MMGRQFFCIPGTDGTPSPNRNDLTNTLIIGGLSFIQTLGCPYFCFQISPREIRELERFLLNW